jgi:hypothetical protein
MGVEVMPASYHYLTHSVQIDVQGVLTVPEVVQVLQDIRRDPCAREGMELLCDLRVAETERVNTTKLRFGTEPIARELPFFNNRIHLVVSTPLQYGFTRMYQTYSSQFGVEAIIYRSIEEAYQSIKEPSELIFMTVKK